MHTTQTREQVILLTLRLASEKGLASVSLSDIAKATHITKASLYSHFSSKEEIIDEMYRLMDTFKGNDMIGLSGSAEEVLQKTVRHWVAAYTTVPMRWAYRIVFQMRFTDQRAAKRAKAILNMFQAQTQAVLETLSDTGRLDIPDLDLATTLFSCAAASFVDEENITEKDEDDWALSRMVQQFCRVFAPR